MDANTQTAAHGDAIVAFRDADGSGAILVDATTPLRATTALFDPATPGNAARPVGVGGRGAAWFVETPAGDAVLRHYRRGGFAARLSRAHYAWQGAERTRGFREFRLLRALHDAGLPVPAPLAALYRRSGLGYVAALLIARIDGARPLGDLLDRGESVPWRAIGATIARFHRAGACHADLNVDNVLMDGRGTAWLIDFDRGALRAPEQRWQRANLARLQRSLRKRIGAAAGAPPIVEGWNALLDSYRAAMAAP